MLTFASRYARNVYSQNGEDGIIEEILNRINPQVCKAVEFGAPNWEYCSNTAFLAEKGWSVRMYDVDSGDKRIEQAKITPQNVNQVVGNDLSVLSIDFDNDDYYIWDAYNGKPDIVIIEINSSIDPWMIMVPGNRGASYRSMVALGLSKGYFLAAHTGNLIFVLNAFKKLFPEIEGHPIENFNMYFNRSFL
jgi:hypothetical protein